MLRDASQTFDDLNNRLLRDIHIFFNASRQHLRDTASRLNALSPLGTMARGFSVVSDKNGSTVKNASGLSLGDPITIYFHVGRADAAVTAVDANAPAGNNT
jgi:exodeoxyribonuclease VII large subunit